MSQFVRWVLVICLLGVIGCDDGDGNTGEVGDFAVADGTIAPDMAPPPVDMAPPPPVDAAPPPVDMAPPPVDMAPPPVDMAPPPVDMAPPPVDMAPPPVDMDLRCTPDSCPAGQICGPDGACIDVCQPGACPGGHCGPDGSCIEGPCPGDVGCGDGRFCTPEGDCADGCRVDPDDCGDGFRCDRGERVCVACADADACGDNIDNDCDGVVDQGCECPEGMDCDTGLQGACGIGQIVCDGDMQRCVPLAVQPESCNDLDDDCDGNTDEDFGDLGDACTVGVGICTTQGQITCQVDGSTGCDARPGVPAGEQCNDLDDDCDGNTDEVWPELGEACVLGAGACAAEGVRVCQGANRTGCNAMPGMPGGAEACDGADNDCDGTIDEGPDGQPVSEPCYDGPEGTGDVGACRVGRRACADGGFGACAGAVLPAPEVCDGVDNDCDGTTDVDGAGQALAQPCYGGPEGTAGVGPCRGGIATCADGGFGACDGEVTPGVEICDGVDNDCNGEVDDVDGGCGACRPAAIRPCYPGAPGTENVGVCRAGEQTCALDGSAWGPCNRAVLPAAEFCDGEDNDCNGRIDDGIPSVGQACAEGVGLCRREGVRICDGNTILCDAQAGQPRVDVCNGLDDDCDESADEGFDVDSLCSVGVGACRRGGVIRCDAAGGAECSVQPGEPVVELCDNADNDCDGRVDEGLDQPEPCNTGLFGTCGTGEQSCVDGRIECRQTVQPGDEICDGLDNDCDDVEDEQLPMVECGIGECRRLIVSCAGGRPFPCDEDAGRRNEICDGLDNDCDGDVDENARDVGRACLLGQGACRRFGNNACVDGELICDAEVVEPQPETCNLVDDDCDGSFDEDPVDVGEACIRRDGACESAGEQECINGDLRCNAEDPIPRQETCDRADNDCDGRTDEGERDCDQNGVKDSCEIELGDGTDCNDNGQLDACDIFGGAGDCDGNGLPDGCDLANGASDCDNDGILDRCNDACGPDVTPPVVDLLLGGNPINRGSQVLISVEAQDNIGVVACSLTMDGQDVPLDGQCQALVNFPTPGFVELIGSASDAAGNSAQDTETMRVLDPDDVDFPELEIHAPPNGSRISEPTPVIATIQDANLINWTLFYGPQNQPDANVVAMGDANVQNAEIGVLDTAVIPEGDWGLLLRAEDINGRSRTLVGVFTVGQCEPVAETCDGADNDCDDRVDEGFGAIGGDCSAGAGACARQGVLRCLADGSGSACDAQPGQPAAETCNEADDDCDGSTDEGFDVGLPCQAGAGVCARDGLTECDGAAGTRCDALAGDPGAEACNQLDDDCDGSIDEDFDPLICGEGRCRQELAQCPGQPPPQCDPFLGARAERCDGIDEDCDGATDEEASDAGAPCAAGVGECRVAGTVQCVGGGLACDAVADDPVAEECNDLDDDCDGSVDEQNICPDEQPPTITVGLSISRVNPGEQVSIFVTAEDDSGIQSVVITADGVPLMVDANFDATFTPQVPGAVEIVVRVTDNAGNVITESTYLQVRDNADQDAPVVDLLTPEQDDVILSAVPVTGTIVDANFFEWKLEIAPGDTDDWIELAVGYVLPADDVFYTLDATMMENGVYRVRLQGQDVNGAISRDEVRVVIDGEAKIGLFTITYTDVTVPIAGMPLTVERTYDSRVKASRDFGVGWTLSTKQGKFEHNREQREGWDFLPGRFNFPCTGGTSEDGIHSTELRVNDKERYAFRLRADAVGAIQGACQVQLSYEFVFSNIPGRARLDIVGGSGDRALYLQGDGLLYTDDLADDYRLTRVRLTTADGRVFFYGRSEDGLFRLEDPKNNAVDINANGLIHSRGKSVDFVRDGAGRITDVVLPSGERILYGYDARGDLVSVTDAMGNVTRYTYDARHNLLDIQDPSGNTPARQIYDEDGRLVAVEYPDGTTVDMNHDPDNRVEVVRDRLGNLEIFEYDEDGNILSHTDKLGGVTVNEFNAVGRLTRRIEPGNAITTYAYDADGRMSMVTNPLGDTRTATYNAANQLTRKTDWNGGVTTKTYDANGNLLSITDPENNVTEFTYDAAGNRVNQTDPEGNITTWAYNADGLVTTETDAEGNVKTFTYDDNNNKLTETVTRGGAPETTTFTYDVNDRLIRTLDPLGNAIRVEYDVRGQKSAEIDSRNFRTEYAYDSLGNNTEVRFADGTVERHFYDAENRRVRTIDRLGRETRIEFDPLGRATRTVLADGGIIGAAYDGRGNLVRETDPRGNEVAHVYDLNNRRVRTTDELGRIIEYTYDANGNRLTLTGPDGEITRYEYDANNKRTATVFPDGGRLEVTYDGNGRKIAESDPNGNVTAWAYDGLGRLVEVTDPAGGVTSYTYDSVGNRLTETDAEGNVTTFEFDARGRPVRKILAGGEAMTATFDAMGNMTARTDYNGAETTYAYNSNGRLTEINLPGGVTERASWTATGRRATVTDARGVTRWTYDERDRVLSRTDPEGTIIRWTYDASGNRTSVATPAGNTAYAYDALNRLTRVTDPDGEVTTYTYDLAGNRATLALPNGLTKSYTYDENRRLTRVEVRDGQAALVAGWAYTVDAGGRRTAVEELHTGRVVDYTYDSLSRLTNEAEDGGRSISYTYDAVGNRTLRDDSIDGQTAYVYDENNRIVTAGADAYAHDANGNVTRVGNTDYTWDSRDRLVLVETAAETVTFEYDIDGHRIGRLVDDGNGVTETRYLVDENRRYTQVFAETDGEGNVQVRYTYGADLLSQHRGATDSYYVLDGQMSVRHLADGAGALTDSYTYDAFGNLLAEEGQTPNDLLYNAQFFDANSGFYYLRARWMDPDTGRFQSVDPAEGLHNDPRTLHRYTYALNSPIDRSDPSGRFSIVSVSVSISISGSLRSIYTTSLLRFFLATVRIATCQLAPAYAQQTAAYDAISNGTPGGFKMLAASRLMIASGFRAIGRAGAEILEDVADQLIDFKIEIEVDLNAAIDALQEQLGDGFDDFNDGVDGAQSLLKAIEDLQKFRDKVNEYYDTAVEWYNTAATILDTGNTHSACDKAKAWEKVGNKLIDLVPSF